MKTKLSKVFGVGLALLLVFSLAFALVPTKEAEAQAFTPNQWNAMPVPSVVAGTLLSGSTIIDFAVASNGTTIYALTGLGAGFRIVKSVTGGNLWSFVTEPVGWTGPGIIIRVAPDDPDAVAVVDSGASPSVYFSKNGGATWANLGDPVLSATGALDASEIISDMEVSPMVATNILERDVLVCTYDTDNCQAGFGGNWGDIYMVGPTLAWASQAQAAAQNYDWTSIALSSNWVGQRAVMGVGSDNVAGGNTEVGWTGDTFAVGFNVNPVVGPLLIAPTPVRLDTGTYDSPCEITAGALNSEMVSSSIALPSDFDSASVAQFTSYIGWTSVQLATVITNGDDAYRVDFNSARKMEIRSTIAIYSVDYFGTCGSGTLYAGERHKTAAFLPVGVWFTSNPTSGLPTWGFSYKSPTSTATANTNCKVVASPVDSNVVFGGCAGGPDTAFSKSLDGGISFNGIGLVDDVIGAMPDVMPTPGAEYVFLATANVTSGSQSLWRCPDMPATGAWERVGFVTAAAANGFTNPTSIIRIDPNWDEAGGGSTTLYWVGTAGGTNILKSPNNGQIWVTRTAGQAAVVDVAVESSEMLYMIAATNVYASTSGGWSFGLPNNPGLGGLLDIAMAPDYPKPPVAGHVLLGGATGIAALSMASAAIGSFIPLSAGPTTGNMQVCADVGYAENNIIYAISANTTATGVGIYRYQFGVSSAWELIDTPPLGNADSGTGIVTDCGVLYGSYISGAGSLANRLFYATAGVADIQTDGMNIGSAAAVFNNGPNALRLGYTDTENRLFAVSTTGTDSLFCYQDTIAKVPPVPVVSSEVIPYDPNVNGSAQFTITWPAVSNATNYDVFFFTDAACTNFAAAWTTAGAAPATAYVPAIAGVPAATIAAGTLNAGTDYWLLMRVRNQVTLDQIRGPWSTPIKISVEPGVPVQAPNVGPTLLGPVPGSTGVSRNPGFSWTPISGATEYQFILATDSTLANAIEGTPVYVTETAWQVPAGTLEYNTTYFWGVRVSKPVQGPQSIGTFTTIAEGVEKYTCQYCGLTFDTRAELDAHIKATHAPTTPLYIWIVIAIGAILVIVVIWLIFSTRRA